MIKLSGSTFTYVESFVLAWLEELQLWQYAGRFADAGVVKPDQCAHLTDSKLQAIGIHLVGHRKRILSNLPLIVVPQLHNKPEPKPRTRTAGSYKAADGTDEDDGEDIYQVPKSLIMNIPPPLPEKTRGKAQEVGDVGSDPVEETFDDLPIKPQSPPHTNWSSGITDTTGINDTTPATFSSFLVDSHPPHASIETDVVKPATPVETPTPKPKPRVRPTPTPRKPKPIPQPRERVLLLKDATFDESTVDDDDLPECSDERKGQRSPPTSVCEIVSPSSQVQIGNEYYLPSDTPKPAEYHPQPAESPPQPTEYHPQPAESTPLSAEYHPQPAESYPQPAEYHPQPAESTPLSAEYHPQPAESHPQPAEYHPQPAESHPQPAESHPQPAESWSSKTANNQEPPSASPPSSAKAPPPPTKNPSPLTKTPPPTPTRQIHLGVTVPPIGKPHRGETPSTPTKHSPTSGKTPPPVTKRHLSGLQPISNSPQTPPTGPHPPPDTDQNIYEPFEPSSTASGSQLSTDLGENVYEDPEEPAPSGCRPAKEPMYAEPTEVHIGRDTLEDYINVLPTEEADNDINESKERQHGGYDCMWNMNSGAASVNSGAASVNSGAASVNSGAASVNSGAASVNQPTEPFSGPPNFPPPPLPPGYPTPRGKVPPPPLQLVHNSPPLPSLPQVPPIPPHRTDPPPTPDQLGASAGVARCRPQHATPPPPACSPHDHRSSLTCRQETEPNIYSPEEYHHSGGGASRSVSQLSEVPPQPPPKVNPFSDRFDPIRNTYDFENYGQEQGSSIYESYESDDTLSDGGDFYEEKPKHGTLRDADAAMPAAKPVKLQVRDGYLHKMSSKGGSSRVKWDRCRVSSDKNYFKYFSTERKVEHSRIIPITTIRNVENDIVKNDSHSFRFKLSTIDRVYTFSALTRDELLLWSNQIMQAVIDSEEELSEGGEMANPDKAGEVKVEFREGKKATNIYIALKGDIMCYYKSINDYRASTPINRMEMQLAAVKEPSRNKLQFITPEFSFMMVMDTHEDTEQWREAIEESIAEALGDDKKKNEVYKNSFNRVCADCGLAEPTWAAVNLGITLCTKCAGVHRDDLSKVRSLRMDHKVWTPSLIEMMIAIGNENSNNFWEWDMGTESIDSDCTMDERREFIFNKYRDKRYCNYYPNYRDKALLNEVLCKCVQYGDVLETLQVLFSGADVHHKSPAYNNQTALELSRASGQTLQMELLVQNGAEGGITRATQNTKRSTRQRLSGYLFKTGSNFSSDFLKRWVVLDKGVLSYYESEKSSGYKDTIEEKEMVSVAFHSDQRFEHAFILGTTKGQDRSYLFAADNEETRQKWVIALCKTIGAMVGASRIDKLDCHDFRGGIVQLRYGATLPWVNHWIHIKGKSLFMFHPEKSEFEEVDLRKVKNLTHQHLDGLSDDGQAFVVDLPANQALYLLGCTRKETSAWYDFIDKVSKQCGGALADKQLMADDVPLIVDKCINFITFHGMDVEGIYRKSGQHSKISKLLESFNEDARSVTLRPGEHDIHDVANALKRFFRSLNDSVLTAALYSKWIELPGYTEESVRLSWYKHYINELHPVHRSTLRRVILHLARVVDHSSHNNMTVQNVAIVFGPVLMTVDDTSGTFSKTPQEIAVAIDMMKHHRELFDVKDGEKALDLLIEEAKKKMDSISHTAPKDLHIPVHIHADEAGPLRTITHLVGETMTALELATELVDKHNLATNCMWGIFEVICDGELERPLHFTERVLEVIHRRGLWPDEIRQDNHLTLKRNVVYENILQFSDPGLSLFSELQYSDDRGKKTYKKLYFEFSQYMLRVRRDTKANAPISEWKAEDITVYQGVQKKRIGAAKGFRSGFTFIMRDDKVTNSYFGHSVICNGTDEMYRWMAAILFAQNPIGLLPKENTVMGSASKRMALPDASTQPVQTNHHRPSRSKSSLMKRLMNR